MRKHKSYITGKLEDCKAKIRKCRYGSVHFTTQEEIDNYEREEQRARDFFKDLAETRDVKNTVKYLTNSQKDTLNPKISEFSVLMRGVYSEVMENETDEENIQAYQRGYSKNPHKQEELNTLLQGLELTHESNLLIVETQKSYHIWTNTSKERDVITVDRNDLPILEQRKDSAVVKRVEVKNIENGAQLSQTQFKDLIPLPKSIEMELSHYNSKQYAYTTYNVDCNVDAAYDYFIRSYESEGTETIVIDKGNGKFLEYNLSEWKKPVEVEGKSGTYIDDYYDLKQQLLKDELGVEITVRTDAQWRNINEEDKKEFLAKYGNLFKDGVAKEKFRLSDLNIGGDKFGQKSKDGTCYVRTAYEYFDDDGKRRPIKAKEPFIRIGDFRFNLPEGKEKGELEDREYSIDEFIRGVPVVTGRIKEFTDFQKGYLNKSGRKDWKGPELTLRAPSNSVTFRKWTGKKQQ